MVINNRSTRAAGRILELAMAKVIAAKTGQSVVLYIYCKAIEDLQQLQESLISRRLKDCVEMWFNRLLVRSQKTKVVALTTDAEELQKMRTYFEVVCPISVNFTQMINLGMYDNVIGITKLRNEIHIMCRSCSTSPIEMRVYEDRIPFRHKKSLKMIQFEDPIELGSCEKESCLYVCDSAGQCVWKIEIETEKEHKTNEWLTFHYVPRHMSVTSDGQLLIVNESSSILMLYESDAKLLRSVQLPTNIKNMWHAVKTSIGNFIIINYEEEEEEDDDDEKLVEENEGERGTMGEHTPKVKDKEHEEERGKRARVEDKEIEGGPKKSKSGKKRIYFIRKLTSDGRMTIRRFVPPNETQQLNYPQNLSVDSDGQVFVADMGNDRVILLDSDLNWKSLICPTKGEEPKIRFPCSLCYDEENKQLIVGGYNGVNVYTLSRN